MSSLQYRKDRMSELATCWRAEKVRDLFISWKVPEPLFDNLRRSIGHIEFDECENLLREGDVEVLAFPHALTFLSSISLKNRR